MQRLLTICRFYTRQVNLIAFVLGLGFALLFALTANPGEIAFDLFALFYGGIVGFAVAGLLMIPVFLILKFLGGDVQPEGTTSALESILFRRPKRKSGTKLKASKKYTITSIHSFFINRLHHT